VNSKTYSSTKKTAKPSITSSYNTASNNGGAGVSSKRVPSNDSVKRTLDIGNANMTTPNSLRMSREVGKSPGKIFNFDKNSNVASSVQYSSSNHQSNGGSNSHSLSL
jgi:hypothetical protein